MKNCNHTGGIEPKEIEFYLYDHLGNTRVVYQPKVAGANLELVINYVADYFPYGKILKEYVNTGSGDPEKFLTTQHERDKETGLDYRGARYYDSDIARFLSLDPLAKEFPSWSAYNYVFSNPLVYTDPTGKSPSPPDWYENEKGEVQYWEEMTDNDFWQYTYYDDGDHSAMHWTKINYVPNQEEASKNEGLLPEMTWESNFGVTLTQGMLQGAAEAAAVEFKYTEAVGIAKNSHVAPLNQFSKTVGNFGTFYTIADKSLSVGNAVYQGDAEKIVKEGTLLAGYTMAAYMMAAPTGVTQLIGGAMFLAIGIYDMFD